MFIVVFEYTAAVEGYAGVRTYAAYEDEENFNRHYTDERQAREKVVAKGVTKEEALILTAETPPSARVATAVAESTDQNGNVNAFILQINMGNIVFAIMCDRDTLRENGRELPPLRWRDLYPEKYHEMTHVFGVDLDEIVIP
ncbi:MAG: hypothetical protein WC310_00455 [Patescibacteria group bacterium]|jgi:hypothetical protein